MKWIDAGLAFLWVVFGVVLSTLFLAFIGEDSRYYKQGYKQGQVDCLEGKVKYKEVRSWEER